MHHVPKTRCYIPPKRPGMMGQLIGGSSHHDSGSLVCEGRNRQRDHSPTEDTRVVGGLPGPFAVFQVQPMAGVGCVSTSHTSLCSLCLLIVFSLYSSIRLVGCSGRQLCPLRRCQDCPPQSACRLLSGLGNKGRDSRFPVSLSPRTGGDWCPIIEFLASRLADGYVPLSQTLIILDMPWRLLTGSVSGLT
jgi:hypothetical protein